MNLFYSARIERMEPKVHFFGGKLVVIRPLAYIEERDIVPFARASGFPIRGEPCPEGLNSRRMVVKRMLRELEQDCHDIKRHIYSAIERNKLAMRDASGSVGTTLPDSDC
jgi:tRNA 2-thiocytidine biosynthesis protein TtcA